MRQLAIHGLYGPVVGSSLPNGPPCLHLLKAIKERNGSWLITADHGNAEQMVDPGHRRSAHAHTTNPVPLIYVAEMPATAACVPMARCATYRPRCWPS